MSFLNQLPLWTFALGVGVMIVIVGIWILVELILNPTGSQISDPDVTARVTGPCGDTMQVTLKIEDGTVTSAGYWADGCGPTSACGAMATRLATGKPAEDIPLTIDHETVAEAVGGLPDDKLHCARLAAETLHEAVHRYVVAHTGSRNDHQR